MNGGKITRKPAKDAVEGPQLPQAQRSFSVPFQEAAIKLILADPHPSIVDGMMPDFFGDDLLRWCWQMAVAYRATYNRMPSWMAMMEFANQALPPTTASLVLPRMEAIRIAPIVDDPIVRDWISDWIQRAIFKAAMTDAAAHFNAGRIVQSYDIMQRAQERMRAVMWSSIDREWLADNFAERVISRQDDTAAGLWIPTGITKLDKILGGGSYPGFLGTWITYPKKGKSTLLVNHGRAAAFKAGRKVLHFVLEGSRRMVTDRYDASVSGDLYQGVKRGEYDPQRYAEAFNQMQAARGRVVVRGLVENWNASVIDMDRELRDLEQGWGWVPDMIIVDYADLLWGREAQYTSTTERQKDAYQCLKSLSSRRNRTREGYAIWTASQVQRPDNDNVDVNPHILHSNDIADAYAKVRICDFIGSINQTTAEEQMMQARLYAELFREGAAHQVINVQNDFSTMRYDDLPEGAMPANPGAMNGKPQVQQLGYGGGFQQQKAGV